MRVLHIVLGVSVPILVWLCCMYHRQEAAMRKREAQRQMALDLKHQMEAKKGDVLCRCCNAIYD